MRNRSGRYARLSLVIGVLVGTQGCQSGTGFSSPKWLSSWRQPSTSSLAASTPGSNSALPKSPSSVQNPSPGLVASRNGSTSSQWQNNAPAAGNAGSASTPGAAYGGSNYQTGPYAMSGGGVSAAGAAGRSQYPQAGNAHAASNGGGIGLYSGSLAGNSPTGNNRTTLPASYNNDGAQGYGTAAPAGRAPNVGIGSPAAPATHGGYSPGAGHPTGPAAYSGASGQYGNPQAAASPSMNNADRYGSPSSNYGNGTQPGNAGTLPGSPSAAPNYGPAEADSGNAEPPATPGRSTYPSTGDRYRTPDSRWQQSSAGSAQRPAADARARNAEGIASAGTEQFEFQNRAAYRPGSTGRTRSIESQWTEDPTEDVRAANYQRQPPASQEGTAGAGANEPADGPTAGSRWQR